MDLIAIAGVLATLRYQRTTISVAKRWLVCTRERATGDTIVGFIVQLYVDLARVDCYTRSRLAAVVV